MTSLCLILAALLPAAATPGSSWTGFRNDGRSISSGPALPVRWSPDAGIIWQRELAGYGQSAPVVWNGTLYLTAVVGPMKEKCRVAAFDTRTGKKRWEYSVAASARAASNYSVARAAPTPLVDAQGVYAFFESGDFLALDHQGRLRWRRSLTKDYGPVENHHGLGGSPVRWKGRLFLNVQHNGPSYLIALDAENGKTLWKVKRASAKSWTTPVVVTLPGETQVVVSSAGTVAGYDARTGARRWELTGIGGNSIPSPTVSGDRVFVGASISDFDTSANAARSNLCLRITPDRSPGYQVLWRAEKAIAYYASPLIHRGCAYYLNRAGVVYCLDATTGRRHYVKRLGVPCWATPVAAGDHIYFFGKNGTTKVIRSGPRYQQVAGNQLWDPADPPKPESYVESFGSHAHGAPKGAKKKRGGFAAMILRSDKNGDGKVGRDEMPQRMKRIFARVDLNNDGLLDRQEIDKMAESFRKRRENSRADSRDPILYGVAAADGAVFIRTGTRLYCIGRSQSPASAGRPASNR